MPRTRSKPSQTAAAAPPASAPAPAGEVLTLAEAAAYLRVSEADVERLARTRDLPGQRIGNDWRFLKAALQDWLRSPEPLPDKQAFWETHFGALKDDPHLEEMLSEIYRRRGRPETEEG